MDHPRQVRNGLGCGGAQTCLVLSRFDRLPIPWKGRSRQVESVPGMAASIQPGNDAWPMAKLGAPVSPVAQKSQETLKVAHEAVEHLAAVAEMLAHRANNVKASIQTADGTWKTVTLRDSTSLHSHHSAMQRASRRRVPVVDEVTAQAAASLQGVVPSMTGALGTSRKAGSTSVKVANDGRGHKQPPVKTHLQQWLNCTAAGVRAWHRSQTRNESKRLEKRRVQAIADRCLKDPMQRPTAERLEAVRKRVLEKQNAALSGIASERDMAAGSMRQPDELTAVRRWRMIAEVC